MAYQLYLVRTDGAAINLVEFDNELRSHLGVEPDPKLWVADWMDVVGFYLAMGKSHDEVIALLNEQYDAAIKMAKGDESFIASIDGEYNSLIKIAEYIKDNCVNESCYCR